MFPDNYLELINYHLKLSNYFAVINMLNIYCTLVSFGWHYDVLHSQQVSLINGMEYGLECGMEWWNGMTLLLFV